VQVTGAATTGSPTLSSQGSDTNIGFNINAKGTGSIFFKTNAGNQVSFVASPTGTSDVNYIQASSSATGNAPVLYAQGSDTNINLKLTPKGTGRVQYGTHTATSDTAISGYVEILDAAGNVRKLAVIS